MYHQHRKASKFLSVVLVCLLAMVSYAPVLPHAEGHSGVSLSGYTETPPTLDGNIGAGEWATAGTKTFGPFTSVSGETITGTLYMMNDGANLYIAVKIDGDSELDSSDGSDVYFDNDHGGEKGWEQGDDCISAPASYPYFYDLFTELGTNPAGPPQLDQLYGGTIDGGAAAARQGNSNHFELRHPLNSADDAHDISLQPFSTVGFALIPYVDGRGRLLGEDGLGSVPDTSSYANYVVAAPSAPKLTWVKSSIVEGAAGTVYYVYPATADTGGVRDPHVIYALATDWSATGLIMGMSAYTQGIGLDSDGVLLSTVNGQPRTDIIGAGSAIAIVSGPVVHAAVHYYEYHGTGADKAPAYFAYDNDFFYFKRSSDNSVLASMQRTLAGKGTDIFLLEVFIDTNGRTVFILYGFTYLGTLAASTYFKFGIYPSLASYTNSYYLIQWTDAYWGESDNGIPDMGDIYTPIT